METVYVDFEQLVNEHKDAVYRQMVRVCRNREDAEDVLIEALLRAFQQLDQLQDQFAFRSWLRQIAQRVCWSLRSREALKPLMQLSALEEQGHSIASREPQPDEVAMRAELKTMLNEVVDELPESYRSVYQLRDVQELSGAAVARQLGLSLPAMKSRLHRARELLREHLDASLFRQTS